LLFRYLLFWLQSGNAHGLHSPFVFDLYTRVITADQPYYIFDAIEKLRQQLLTSEESIDVQDFGAGSKLSTASRRPIRTIARHSLKNARLGQLLFRLANHFQPAIVLDLGTSLGITTAYLAAACQKAAVYTFEGCPHTLAIASSNFTALGLRNIISVGGNIDETLPQQVSRVDKVDFVFFDANHRLEPTLRYFHQCLTKAHENTVFVFDDIYWSREMTEAWKQIKSHEAVTVTVDLFYIGIVFFRKKQPKQDFVLRF
jgi:predicted O-methyltransferase YrrM